MVHECEGEAETGSEYAGGGSRGKASVFICNWKMNFVSLLTLKTLTVNLNISRFIQWWCYLVISRRWFVELYGAVARRSVQVIVGQRDRNDVDRRLIHGSSLSLQALYALLTGPLEYFTEASTAECQKNKGYDRHEDPERTTILPC